ncbi:MAG: malate synthase A [Alphaproteobacteria bacterium]|nr:malate synthase A [Alphaproteobacteria bacterium]
MEPSQLSLAAPLAAEHTLIFTPEAQAFVASLTERFGARRNALLAKRLNRQQRLDGGELPDFLPDTQSIRDGDWQVAPIPEDLQDRRVEITGPVERKMIINALNSGAKVFMADFEDSLTPTWKNVMDGQVNLYDAVRRTIAYTSPEGKAYQLGEKTAVLIVRPRGWHLDERHVTYNGRAVPGALIDFGVYFYMNAKELLSRGSGPYFYIPKLESHEEAQLWTDIFAFAEETLGLKRGTIKATVLIETILATFEMHEILYALRDYCVGLNCGRWDYIFSFIKKFHKRPDFVLPERAQVTMTTHFLRSYSLLLIQTCHRRGAFAMGGMSAYIPVKNDEAANDKAFAMVRADKEREAGDGHDGTWVAHPGLVPVALEVFNRLMPGKNQLSRQRDDVHVTAEDLLAIPPGTITEAGFRNNISVSVQYIANWLNGLGCVPINNLMEDAATAEIARAQLWQWMHHDKGVLDNGHPITGSLYEEYVNEELKALEKKSGEQYGALPYEQAARLLTELVSQTEFTEFLTLPAYLRLNG